MRWGIVTSELQAVNWRRRKTPRIQLIEKQTQPMLCSLELNRWLSWQVGGEESEKLLSSQSLTDQNA